MKRRKIIRPLRESGLGTPGAPRLTARTREEHDRETIEDAAYWTTFRRRARFDNDRQEWRSREEAEEFARSQYGADGRTMIYAVDRQGQGTWVANV